MAEINELVIHPSPRTSEEEVFCPENLPSAAIYENRMDGVCKTRKFSSVSEMPRNIDHISFLLYALFRMAYLYAISDCNK